MTDDEVEFVDEVPGTIMSKVGVVTRKTPKDDPGFAVNILPAGAPPGFTEKVIQWFEDRYDVDRFEDRETIGVVIVDADDPSTVFPVGRWDTVAFRTDSVAPDVGNDDEVVQGGVAMVGRSGTLRVRGVGAVDVEPTDVVKVTKRYADKE